MHRLGVDIGGVITDRKVREDQSIFGENYLSAPATTGSFDSLQRLNHSQPYRDNIWLASKCNRENQGRIQRWLAHNGFHETTGIPPERALYTPQRIGKLAIAECQGFTDFVDDRLDILAFLVGTVPNLYLFDPEEEQVDKYDWVLPYVKVVEDWQHLEHQLLQGAA